MLSADEPARPAPTGESDRVTIETWSGLKKRSTRAANLDSSWSVMADQCGTLNDVPVSSETTWSPAPPASVSTHSARIVMAALSVWASS